MADLLKKENSGLIIEIKPTDFRAGGETAIKYEARNADGDWEKYRPTDEWQRRYERNSFGYDTNSCVTFSGIRCIAIQIEWMLEHGLIPASTKAIMEELGYFDEEGKINFSEWFSANTNGTTNDGNTFQNFWDGVDRDGLLPHADGFVPNDFKDYHGWFDKSKITPEMRAKAKRFLDLFDTRYEWAILNPNGNGQNHDAFAYHLKHAPIHIGTPTCGSWNNRGIVTTCDPYRGLNHATTMVGMEKPKYYKDLDHYVPFIKQLAWDYYIPYGIKGVVYLVGEKPKPTPFKYTFAVNLRYGMGSSTEVKNLQMALQSLQSKAGKPYMTPGQFGPYGPATKAAVGLWQTEHGIKDPEGQGTNFGPLTRASVNNALAAL